MKTYSADSGHVYQYQFQGFRELRSRDLEYAFLVTTRDGVKRVTVLLKRSVLTGWEARHDRNLSASERFGLAKMALRFAFDEAPIPHDLPPQISPDTGRINAITSELHL